MDIRLIDDGDEDCNNSTKLPCMIDNMPSSLMQEILDQQNDTDTSNRSNNLTNDATDRASLTQLQRNLLNRQQNLHLGSFRRVKSLLI